MVHEVNRNFPQSEGHGRASPKGSQFSLLAYILSSSVSVQKVSYFDTSVLYRVPRSLPVYRDRDDPLNDFRK